MTPVGGEISHAVFKPSGKVCLCFHARVMKVTQVFNLSFFFSLCVSLLQMVSQTLPLLESSR